MSRPILGYWNIRGLAQPIRHMLVYAGVDFEDKLYNFGPAPDFNRSDWFDVKFTFGFDFPNLPYYLDGDLKITQSQAIYQHIARKCGLYGKTEAEKARIDMLDGTLHDVFMAFIQACFDLKKKPDFMKTLPEKLKAFSEFLGTRKWFAGDNISFVDFKMCEFFRSLSKFHNGCLDDFDNLKNLTDSFENLPAIAKYMKSPNYLHKPILTEMAEFRGD